MAVVVWDQIGERFYETGVDHAVLYIPDENGVFNNGVAWNGITGITESPTGGEANRMYADNIVYLNLYSREELDLTLEAYTYPDEFNQFDGVVSPVAGMTAAQQTRTPFGLSYRTNIGNDLEADEHGYKLHLLYGVTASPTEKNYQTINESPDAINFSWDLSTVPVLWDGGKPTSMVTLDSRVIPPADMAAIETLLYGDVAEDPALPTPDELVTLLTP